MMTDLIRWLKNPWLTKNPSCVVGKNCRRRREKPASSSHMTAAATDDAERVLSPKDEEQKNARCRRNKLLLPLKDRVQAVEISTRVKRSIL